MSPILDPAPLLATLTTMRVGGAATEHWRADSRAELVEAARQAWSEHERWIVLGGGSNLVAPGDADGGGFDGAVVQAATRGVERVAGDGPAVALRIEAGHPWDELVAQAVAEGLAGIEALSGIPGSVGAAPVQNIGAYGQELASVLTGIEFLDEESGELLRLGADELELGYRTSALKAGRRGVVTAVDLALERTADGASEVRYPQLATALGVRLGDRVGIAEIREAVLELRRAKGMVLDPADPASIGCGSFFVNPVVSASVARALPADAPRWPLVLDEDDDLVVPLGDEPAVPTYAPGADVKLSAAWLIERAGIGRGFTIPGLRAGVSPKHTLAIVNLGGATSEDVLGMATYIQTRVASEFGVVLQPEPTILLP